MDSESNRFYTEQIEGDDNFNQVRRIVNRYRPVELILQKKAEYNKQFRFIAKSICSPFILEVEFEKRSVETMITDFSNITNLNPFFRQMRLLF